MRKLFKERNLFKGGNYMRKYGMYKSEKKILVNRAGLAMMISYDD